MADQHAASGADQTSDRQEISDEDVDHLLQEYVSATHDWVAKQFDVELGLREVLTLAAGLQAIEENIETSVDTEASLQAFLERVLTTDADEQTVTPADKPSVGADSTTGWSDIRPFADRSGASGSRPSGHPGRVVRRAGEWSGSAVFHQRRLRGPRARNSPAPVNGFHQWNSHLLDLGYVPDLCVGLQGTSDTTPADRKALLFEVKSARGQLTSLLGDFFANSSPAPAQSRLLMYTTRASVRAVGAAEESILNGCVSEQANEARLSWFTERHALQRWIAVVTTIEGGGATRRYLNATVPGIESALASTLYVNEIRRGFIRGSNLSGIPLGHLEVQSPAAVQDCNLQYAILRHAKFRDSDFRNCNLVGADLFGADLRGVNFGNSSVLADADLRGADLRGADIAMGSVDGVRWDRSTQCDAALSQLLDLHSRRLPDGSFIVELPRRMQRNPVIVG